MTMRPSSILSEATRNFLTRTSRPVLSSAVLGIVVVGLMLAELLVVTNLIDDFTAFQARAATVSSVSAPKGIDGAACDALSSTATVRASGAFSDAGRMTLAELPSTPIPVKAATPGFVSVIAPDTDAAGVDGVLIPLELARTLSVEVGDDLHTDAGDARIAAVYAYPEDGRAPGFAWAIVVPKAATGRFDDCWYDVPLGDEASIALGLTAVSAGTADRPKLSQVNTTLGAAFEPLEKFAGRVTRWNFAAAFVLAGLAAMVLRRSRALEIATSLHLRVTKRALIAQGLYEEGLVLVAMLPFVLASACLPVLTHPDDAGQLAWLATLVWIFGAAGALAGNAVATASVRRNAFVFYFKGRA